MTIQERLVETLRHLSPQDQRRVLDFATRLERPAGPRTRKNPRRMLAGLGPTATEAEHRDAWADFPRDFPG